MIRARRVAGAFLVVFAMSREAGAQGPSELVRARERYDDALGLEAGADWAGALAELHEVARVRLTPQVRFHIARCEEHLGWWVSALGKYRVTVAESEQVSGAEEAHSAAEEAIARLERQIPILQLEVLGAPARVDVFVDGKPTGTAALGTPILVDPGQHRLEAKSSGESVVQLVTLVPAQRLKVSLSFHAAPQAVRPVDVPKSPPSKSSQAPFVLIGLGALSIAAGFVALAIRQDAAGELRAQCIDGHCPADLASTGQRGQIANAVTIAGLGAGTALAATGVVWLMTGSSSRRASVSVRPLTSSGGETGALATLRFSF